MGSISTSIRGLIKLQHKFSTDLYPFQNNILVDMSSVNLPIANCSYIPCDTTTSVKNSTFFHWILVI